ncbi:MAG: DUF58 domain-containing protein, partial [Solirubrobacteraceae bacterium]
MARPRTDARRAAAVAAGGAVLAVVGFAFAAAPLLVAAVALVALGLTMPAWVWVTARGARVVRRCDAERVIEDDPLEMTLVVRRGPLGLPGALLADPCSGALIPIADALSPIHGERRVTVRVVASFSRRGRHLLAPPTLAVRDPLELSRALIEGQRATRPVLVLPRTERVRWLGSGEARRMLSPDGAAPSDALAAIDLDGLRQYRPGTPASRIHWPALARGAGLLERRLRADGDARPLIVLDARTPGPPGPEDEALVDAAVRAAASLALELSAGGCSLLLPGEQRATRLDRALAQWPEAYARLAVVRGGTGCPAPALAGAGQR